MTPAPHGGDPGLSGVVLEFLDLFEQDSTPDDTTVRIVLTNGEPFYFGGLVVDRAPGWPRLVMFGEAQSPHIGALVVREEHILSIDFQKPMPESPPKPPAGFKF